ncbi:MAG: VOC family protein [bacterium]|nr:VOC family protein [bacterium]
MIVGLEAILVSTQSARKLGSFYEDIVGLKKTMEMEIGEKGELAISFALGKGPGLYILDHSQVKGKNANASRIMFNLEVDDIEREVKRMKKKKVKIVKDIYHMQDYGFVATFADTDGNYFQFVKTRE